ncbi:MAG: pectate lyase [Pirellulaceae bacterium]|nr:pectate lyase [Pirellulaceae bacterium]
MAILISLLIISAPISSAAEFDGEVAERMLLYQRDAGGWPKNYDRKRKLSQSDRKQLTEEKSRNDSTIDNGATHTEIQYLAKAFHETHDQRYRDAALRGIEFVLQAQYKNGGWPQRPEDRSGYSRHITFNDGAMIGVMSMLRAIAKDRSTYSFVSPALRNRCAQAIKRGIDCILRCQIVVAGNKTVWCAQHDEVSFEPRRARSYELPSLSGSESVGIVKFLMKVENPNQQIIDAIESATSWFRKSQLQGIRVERVSAPTQPNGYDRIVVKAANAPPMWARFYTIEGNQPIYCSRDGIPIRSLAEISHERRNGYSWLGYYATDLLEKQYPTWKSDQQQP